MLDEVLSGAVLPEVSGSGGNGIFVINILGFRSRDSYSKHSAMQASRPQANRIRVARKDTTSVLRVEGF